MTDKEKLDAIRVEIHRLVDVRGYDREMANDLLTFIDSLPNEPKECMYSKANYTDEDRKVLCEGCEEECKFNKKEEPVRIKKGCKYRCLSDMQNTDTGAISFFKDKIYSAPEDNTLVSEENGWLCDLSENSSNFELIEEPVSEDLEEAIGEYCSNPDNFISYVDTGFAYRSEQKDDIPLIIKAIKFGAKWKEQQMEAYRIEHCKSLTNEQAELEENFVSSHVEKNNRIPTFIDAIEYGIEYGKQQLMAKAVDIEVKVDAGGYPYIPQMELYDYEKDIPLAKEGDKYKVILIKED